MSVSIMMPRVIKRTRVSHRLNELKKLPDALTLLRIIELEKDLEEATDELNERLWTMTKRHNEEVLIFNRQIFKTKKSEVEFESEFNARTSAAIDQYHFATALNRKYLDKIHFNLIDAPSERRKFNDEKN